MNASPANFEYQMQRELSSGLNENEYSNYGGGSGGGGGDGSGLGLAGQPGVNASSSSYGQGQPGSTGFLPTSPNSRHEDLKVMLESNKDGLKLEAMKRLISMIAKGRGSSDTAARELFPHVVKNVVTKNAELKKLVYLYLTRYAEQEQDLALLSISSFQRSLKDPNPLIRASALRVLSSIRVPMIAPIMLVAVKDCSNDMSPYVRKTAAHAIPKLFSLDPELKEEIIQIIERLLNDKTSLVLGSAVAAFEEVCPDRLDLIHANYRKFASLMADFDEWGQIILLNMLIRYTRTQFLDPNVASAEHSTSDISGLALLDPDHRLVLRNAKPLLQSRNSAVVMAVIQLYLSMAPVSEINAIIVKPLIRLLHSHKEIQAVILANIVSLTGKAVNVPAVGAPNGQAEDDLHYPRPRQAALKSLFEPYLKSFFVKARDSTQVKVLKLEILTNLSNSSNIPLILREFQAYIQNYQEGDMDFVSATIQAIGRCATRIKEVAPICLNGLITLLSNRNETIVAQSIIVIRTQIINKDSEEKENQMISDSHESNASSLHSDSIVSLVIKQVTKLVEKITTPNARATILWILAEFCDKNAKALQAAPDILRQTAKTFCNESDLVKLQTLNLAAKLFITTHPNNACEVVAEGFNVENRDRLKLLVNYIFNLAKYDVNYDVRDRGRFLRQLLNECDTSDNGLYVAKFLLMAPKRAHSANSSTKSTAIHNSSNFRIGTLSHFVGKQVSGYAELPHFPEEQPDTSVRNKADYEEPIGGMPFELIKKEHLAKMGRKERESKSFYPKGSSSGSEDEDDDDDDSDDESGDESSDEEDESGSELRVDDSSDDEDEDDDEDKEVEDEEESDDDDDSSQDLPPPPPVAVAPKPELKNVQQPLQKANDKRQEIKNAKKPKEAIDLLLDFDSEPFPSDVGAVLPLFSSQGLSLLASSSASGSLQANVIVNGKYRILESAEFIPTTTYELVKVPGKCSIIYRFPRIREGSQTLVELIVSNEKSKDRTSILIKPTNNANLMCFKGHASDVKQLTLELNNGEIKLVTLGVDFKESPSQGVELSFDEAFTGKIMAPIGEIMVPVIFVSRETFGEEQTKLCGMNEVNERFILKPKGEGGFNAASIARRVLKVANLGTNRFADSDSVARYSGATLKTNCLVLVTIEWEAKGDEEFTVKQTVNCERMMIGSMLSKHLKDTLLSI